jgi:hypothetical protein
MYSKPKVSKAPKAKQILGGVCGWTKYLFYVVKDGCFEGVVDSKGYFLSIVVIWEKCPS